ncbi:GumC family protein [Palleronia sp. LCG004]|uniref:GumC family protein n=1 Tax=Palleronia sp. LCG004 TaxID=3079304 RepID=UPI002941D382|nr:Wzz/FepE/Etk N-terminal domain-containing protein [Palleronia sp. LCG004]WOI58421.1 Wzz/FepE/Etk N-terminal domain-containing protein [Palleronia sp. LCG004]
MDLRFYLGLFLRRLPLLIAFAVVGAVLGVVVALSQQPVYSAQATLIVESEQIPENLASSTVQASQNEMLQIIQQRILSRDVLLELANRLNIYAGVEDAASMTADEKVSDLRQRISIRTRGGGSPTEAMIVTVSFDATTPQITAQVVNDIVTQILQQNVRMRTSVATQTLDFFTQEVDRLEQQLSAVSERILDFQESNLQALPDSLEFRRSQQAALQERLLQLERDGNALRERRRQLVTLFEETGRVGFAQQQGGNMSPQEARLAELRDEYAQLAGVLSDTNPRLNLLRSRISAIEGSMPAAGSSQSEGSGGTAPTLYDIQIADIDTQIENVEEQSTAIENQMENLSATIQATPGNAVTLNSLEREYENLQAQYNQAVTNRARADMGNTIESLSKGQRISVIEQATRPSSPSSPNRPFIATAGLGAGLAAGIALIVLMEILNSAIRRPQDLQNALGIDTLATIPYIQTREEVRTRRMRLAVLTALLVVGIPALLWFVDRNITSLQPVFENVAERVRDTLNL